MSAQANIVAMAERTATGFSKPPTGSRVMVLRCRSSTRGHPCPLSLL